ncbi:hypothetical protein RHMOL_Rhmol12G0014600 [Rhododendron molle]|uniref:Uncharacterized protein n=1 Tax=Rhododendron molle TaxID=49168 RepID=A0ACC0LDG6_RHOML|nr:hypothetical protein RHMOL_Rhmol12G0014600 [Rhododendron molle]
MATSGSISAGRGRGRGGAGVQIPVEFPQLPVQVEYYNIEGQGRFIDIPSPDHVELTLPPGVQQVSREYVEACFRVMSGLKVRVRQQRWAMDQLCVRDRQQRTTIRRQRTTIRQLRDAIAMQTELDEEAGGEDDEDGYVTDASPLALDPHQEDWAAVHDALKGDVTSQGQRTTALGGGPTHMGFNNKRNCRKTNETAEAAEAAASAAQTMDEQRRLACAEMEL